MKISQNKKFIIICAALAAINALFAGAAVFTTGNILQNSKALGDSIVKLDTKRLSAENLHDNLNLIKEMDLKVASYDRLFFTQGQELQLITDLENMATKNKVSQKISSPNLDNYTNNRIDIVLSVSGPYLNTLKYMSDLENYKYIMAIEKIYFQPGGFAAGPDGTSEFMAALQITLSLYANPKQ